MNPLLKWVGGKRDLAPALIPLIQNKLKNRYIEPFFGGGSIFFGLAPSKAVVSDVCPQLINFYRVIAKDHKAFYWALRQLINRGLDKETYYVIRDEVSDSLIIEAARFYYINVVGFNGLWRVNKYNRCNVAYGDNNKNFKPLTEFEQAARLLYNVTIVNKDGIEVINQSRSGDVVYVDSPYYGTFDKYTSNMFTEHETLAKACKSAKERGVAVFASNRDCVEIRELYSWASEITIVGERRRINVDLTNRGKTDCVLIIGG